MELDTHNDRLEHLYRQRPGQTAEGLRRLLPDIKHAFRLHAINLGQDLLHEHLGLEALGGRNGANEAHGHHLANGRLLVAVPVGREGRVHGLRRGRAWDDARLPVVDTFLAVAVDAATGSRIAAVDTVKTVVEEGGEGRTPHIAARGSHRRVEWPSAGGSSARQPPILDLLFLGAEDECHGWRILRRGSGGSSSSGGGRRSEIDLVLGLVGGVSLVIVQSSKTQHNPGHEFVLQHSARLGAEVVRVVLVRRVVVGEAKKVGGVGAGGRLDDWRWRRRAEG